MQLSRDYCDKWNSSFSAIMADYPANRVLSILLVKSSRFFYEDRKGSARRVMADKNGVLTVVGVILKL